MLSFTSSSRQSGTKTGFNINKNNINQPKFEPIIINNHEQKQKKQKSFQKINKGIFKVTQDKFTIKNTQSKSNKLIDTKNSMNNKIQWNNTNFKKGQYDSKLKKNQLAAQQRRLKAQMKKQKQLIHQQIVINQKKIGTKSLKMLKDKDQEIQYLKNMIQKQKQQKNKMDKLYQQKKNQIQKQRQQLIELQKRIQKQGIKQKKVLRQVKRIASPQKQVYEQNRTRKNVINQSRKMEQKRSYDQPTQSQYLHQKNELRQKQIQYLINQRQKCIKGFPNINYTPTLIPLLSKASYKIISTHVSQIVQLLIDDMLEQQVYLLQQIQLLEAKNRQQAKQKDILNDYKNMIEEFVEQNEQIRGKVGKYQTMNFTDIYKPKYYPESSYKSAFKYDKQQQKIVRKLTLDHFDDDRFEEIDNRKDRFIRFVSNFDQYKKSNMKMFQDCTQQIINQAIQKLTKQLDKGSGEFVQIVFRNQFK